MPSLLPHSNKIALPITFTYKDNCNIANYGHLFRQIYSIGNLKHIYEVNITIKNLTPIEYLDIVQFLRTAGQGTLIQIYWAHLNQTHLGLVKNNSVKIQNKDTISFGFIQHGVTTI